MEDLYANGDRARGNSMGIGSKIHFRLKFLVHILVQYAQESGQEFDGIH